MEKILNAHEKLAKEIGISRNRISTFSNKFIDKSIKNLGTQVVEEAPNGSLISYDVYTRLLKDRVLFLGHQISDDIVNVAIAQLLFLEMADEKKDITLMVNSGGGSVVAGLALIDCMNYIKPDVSTLAVGMAASMGAVILTSGVKKKRFSLPNAEIMVHQVLGGVEGQYSDMEIGLKHMERLKKKLYSILSETSGKEYSYIEKICDRNYWMTPIQAQEEGLIDEILIKRK